MVLADTSWGVTVNVPEAWQTQDTLLGPGGITLRSGEITAELRYYSVRGRGFTGRDLTRVNQKLLKELLRGSYFSRNFGTEEISLGARAVSSSGAAQKPEGQFSYRVVHAAWKPGPGDTYGAVLEVVFTLRGHLRWTDEALALTDSLLAGIELR